MYNVFTLLILIALVIFLFLPLATLSWFVYGMIFSPSIGFFAVMLLPVIFSLFLLYGTTQIIYEAYFSREKDDV